MHVLGVILARGGSAGLKNKHLLDLLGRPVISYTFEHARRSARLTRVVVSSDCLHILRLAAAQGFTTVVRPAELATAEASVQDVMLHAMGAVEAVGKVEAVEAMKPAEPARADSSGGRCVGPGFRADALVVLYGNVPVRGEGVIDRAVDLLQATGCDSVRSFCPVGKWHPAWMAKLAGPAGDRVEALRPGSIHRRQDLEREGKLLLHDGAVVAVSRASMLRGRENPQDPHAFFGADRRGFETAADESVEIDTRRDLFWAEAVLREQQERRERKERRVHAA